MQVFSTIVPIFSVVILGFIARKRGFMPPEFLGPANRLVYYLAIPALIFRSVSKASFRTEFNITVLSITLLSAVLIYSCVWVAGRFVRWPAKRIGAFIQCAGHGNLGYIGFPIAFYYIGESGFAKASILAGFLSILQNLLSVTALQTHTEAGAGKGKKFGLIVKNLVRHPVIVSALAGIAVSISELAFHPIIDRFLEVLGGLAPPLSLLLIGASLSLQVMRKNFFPVAGAVIAKIVVLPLFGLIFFYLFRVEAAEFLPGLILLATPTATVAYVMAKEMNGDDEFSVAAISTSTVLSAFTYLILLTLVGSG